MPDQNSNDKGQTRRELRFAGEIPDVIKNVRRERTYHKGRLLGKGGFARCYELIEQATGRYYAGKAILLKSLSKKRYSEKLALEIKIHGSLVHQYVCRLYSTFHDTIAYYLIMELCSGGTLADLIKARGCLTEPEARYFMRQLLLAMVHMKDKGIIHRDLKPANVFLSESLEVKVGDFGLATIMHTETERHTSMCGTPNYIAPEILATHIYNRFIRVGSSIPPDEQYIDSETVALARKKDEGLKRGHFYPIDIWCAGNILYCMLYGKAAFECGSIKETYKKVLSCMTALEFPAARGISRDAEKLIRQMLNENPLLRPTPEDVLESDWMQGYIPQVSKDTLKVMPSYASSRDRDYAEMLGGIGTHASFEKNPRGEEKQKNVEKKKSNSSNGVGRELNPNKNVNCEQKSNEGNGKKGNIIGLPNEGNENNIHRRLGIPDIDHQKDNNPLNLDPNGRKIGTEERKNCIIPGLLGSGNEGNMKLEPGTMQTPIVSRTASKNKLFGSENTKNFTQLDNDFTSTATSPSAKLTQNNSKKTNTDEQKLAVIEDNMEALAGRKTRTNMQLHQRARTGTNGNQGNNYGVDALVPINKKENNNNNNTNNVKGAREIYRNPRMGNKRDQMNNDCNSEVGGKSQSASRKRINKKQGPDLKPQHGNIKPATKLELPSISDGGQREMEKKQQIKLMKSPSGMNPRQYNKSETNMTPKNVATAKYSPPTLQAQKSQSAQKVTKSTIPLHVIAWVDYSNRFGFGCQLSDGTVAVAFNDGTSASVSPLGTIFEIQSMVNEEIVTSSGDNGISRYSFKNTPRQVREKAGLLKYFQEYLESRILVPVPTEYRPPDPPAGTHLIQLIQWRHFGGDLLVRLNDGTVQCNFSDHTKLILNKVTVSLIDENREISTYVFNEISSQTGPKVGRIVERISHLRSYMKKITEDSC